MSLVQLLLLLFSARVCGGVPEKPKRSALNQLTRTLLRNYDSGVRPVQNWTSTTTVSIDLILQSVLDVDGKTQSITISIWYRQIWTDEFLVWDPEEFDGITEISMSSDAIWVPDIIITEFVDEGKSPPIPYVYINSSGSVKNYKPMQVVLACSLEMYAFPFDKHNCSLTFRSGLHSVKEIDLSLWRSSEEISSDKRQFMNDGEWELLSIPSLYYRRQQDHTDYAHVRFNVLIRRRPLLYVVGLLIPSIFLMLVDVVSFYLPLDSGVRIAFKISILLGYTVFRVNLTDELPSSAVSTPLIGVFFVACMALLMLSLIKSMVVVKLLHHSEAEVRNMSLTAALLQRHCQGHRGHRGGVATNATEEEEEDDDEEEEELQSSPEEEEEEHFQDGGSSSSSSCSGWLLLQELRSLRAAVDDGESRAQAEWLRLCSRLDLLLFRLYLLLLLLYTAALLLLWSSWSFA